MNTQDSLVLEIKSIVVVFLSYTHYGTLLFLLEKVPLSFLFYYSLKSSII